MDQIRYTLSGLWIKFMNQQFLKQLQTKYGKQNPAFLKAGDTVRIFERIREKEKDRVQVFEGLVIATKHGHGLDGSFTVRKIAAGNIGVEKVYPLHNPIILKIERLKSAKTSRAKIYFMRDRYGKAARFKVEKPNPGIWEEKGAEEELEKIADETAQAAEEAKEAREKQEKEQSPRGEVVKEEEKNG